MFENINWSNFYQAYTGMRFSIKDANCKVFIPTYKHLSKELVTPSLSGSNLVLKDEFTTNTFIGTGSTEKIDSVLLSQLWEYAEGNILWDEFTEELSFKDIEVDEVKLSEFIKDSDQFLVYHKLSKFGNYWWSGRVTTDFVGDNTDFSNVTVKSFDSTNKEKDLNDDFVITYADVEAISASLNTNKDSPLYYPEYDLNNDGLINGTELSAITGSLNTSIPVEKISFWSPDKYVNDEYKKYAANPTGYVGFFTSTEFKSHGWFTVPDLKLSTKPFEKLKIAWILLNLNFTFDPKYFGDYYTLDSKIAGRTKDLTSGAVLDQTLCGGSNNKGFFSDNLLSNWIGGLTNTANMQTIGEFGSYTANNCSTAVSISGNEISHAIAGQISLNLEYDQTIKEILGTVDSINWRSSEKEVNSHGFGILNTDRAFGKASGSIDSALIFGGIQTSKNSIGNLQPTILNSIELWNGTNFSSSTASSSVPRCFHIQGGSGIKTAVSLGGFSEFNVTNEKQFAEYGKDGVLSNLEIFIKGDEPQSSYFKTVPNFNLINSRGDCAGSLVVTINDRQDKFQIKDALSAKNLSKDDEQTLSEFVNTNSGNDNAKRYSVINTTGIVFGGSSTGKSFLTDVATTNDLLDTCEKLSSIFVDLGTTNTSLLDIPSTTISTSGCLEVIKDVITINGTTTTTANPYTLTLSKSGKYKIKYLDGAWNWRINSGGKWVVQLSVKVNDIVQKLAFPTPLEFVSNRGFDSDTTLKQYFSLPENNEYIFCSPIDNSILSLYNGDSYYDDNAGSTVFSLCYLGTDDSCSSAIKISNKATSIAINYTKIDSNLQYPFPVHGLCYVGTDTNGLSTGGRCELSELSINEEQIFNKYKTGYTVDFILNESYDNLIKQRVSDLCYENNGTTWVRKQNLVESVYYHAGVGNQNHALFWGGIHDSITNYESLKSFVNNIGYNPYYDIINEENRIIISDSETLEANGYDKTLIGGDYTTLGVRFPTINMNPPGFPGGSNPVLNKLEWESAPYTNVYDNPLYKQSSTNLIQFARDTNFPDIEILSLFPNTATALTTQSPTLSGNYVSSYVGGLTAAGLTSTLTISGNISNTVSFPIQAKTVLSPNNFVYGNLYIKSVNISYELPQVKAMPLTVSSKTNETIYFQLYQIVQNDNIIDVKYRYIHSFDYVDSVTSANKQYSLDLSGTMHFTSWDHLWNNSIKLNTTSIASSTECFISGYDGVVIGTANIKFDVNDPLNASYLVGIRNNSTDWVINTETTQISGSTFGDKIDMRFYDNFERWGTPLWTSPFYKNNVGINVRTSINSTFTDDRNYVRSFTSDTYHITGSSFIAMNNNRLLIKGHTEKQVHNVTAISISAVDYLPTTYIRDYFAQGGITYNVPISGYAYTEWASSLVQEYRPTKPYKVPNKNITANGWNIDNSFNGNDYQQSAWKRYMDGVGLGGDAPDYDTIYNSSTNKINPITEWDSINYWFVGQIAVGTPSRSLIVGGHKVSKEAGRTGIGAGLHASETSKRTFLWDFTDIPPEDSYLSNYLGRKFNTSENGSTLTSQNNKNDLNCMIFDANSDIIIERRGTVVFDGGTNPVVYNFDEQLPSDIGTNYSLALTPNDNVKIWWSDKTLDGFTLYSEIDTWKGKVDFLLTAVIKVVEKDITDLGATDGYIFNK